MLTHWKESSSQWRWRTTKILYICIVIPQMCCRPEPIYKYVQLFHCPWWRPRTMIKLITPSDEWETVSVMACNDWCHPRTVRVMGNSWNVKWNRYLLHRRMKFVMKKQSAYWRLCYIKKDLPSPKFLWMGEGVKITELPRNDILYLISRGLCFKCEHKYESIKQFAIIWYKEITDWPQNDPVCRSQLLPTLFFPNNQLSIVDLNSFNSLMQP